MGNICCIEMQQILSNKIITKLELADIKQDKSENIKLLDNIQDLNFNNSIDTYSLSDYSNDYEYKHKYKY